MGDFLIDFRAQGSRGSFSRAAAFLKFQEHVRVETLEFPEFSLALSSVDSPALWGSYSAEDVWASVCGRIDLEESEWQAAEKVEGQGGLASKAIAKAFRAEGRSALEKLSGNFAALLWDRKQNLFFVAGDLCGALPIFRSSLAVKPVFASHADALALCIDETENLDETSLQEFLLTSCVTPPYSYYRNIRSLPEGTLVAIDLKSGKINEKKYFSLDFRGDDKATENDLAAELADNLRGAIRRRTLPRLGPVAVALSGGLDSRTILAAIPDRSNTFAFCCFNEENFEFNSARSVARALDVKLIPLTRNFDYYGDHAEAGIKIAGGMGTFANNHFLGVSRPLRELGVQNLLTGCYCDYLFKGLPLNTTASRFSRKERVVSYSHEFYFHHYRMDQAAAKPVWDRLDQRFSHVVRNSQKAKDLFQIEKLRTFPFFQEGDNAQRLVPQRLLYSYLPVADRSILQTYCRIPYHYKLNRSLFKKTVEIICGPKVCKVPDANTGAPANASLLSESLTAAGTRLKRRFEKRKPSIVTATSWPDWTYYVPHSDKLKAMWEKPCAATDEIFRKVLQPEDIRPRPADYSGNDLFLFVQMLSLKIWMSQRC